MNKQEPYPLATFNLESLKDEHKKLLLETFKDLKPINMKTNPIITIKDTKIKKRNPERETYYSFNYNNKQYVVGFENTYASHCDIKLPRPIVGIFMLIYTNNYEYINFCSIKFSDLSDYELDKKHIFDSIDNYCLLVS